jgi:hypothetical protein
VKKTKLKKGAHITMQSQEVMALKWTDKKPVIHFDISAT